MHTILHLFKYGHAIFFWNIVINLQIQIQAWISCDFISCINIHPQSLMSNNKAFLKWALLVHVACSQYIGNTAVSDFIPWVLHPSHDLLQIRLLKVSTLSLHSICSVVVGTTQHQQSNASARLITSLSSSLVKKIVNSVVDLLRNSFSHFSWRS